MILEQEQQNSLSTSLLSNSISLLKISLCLYVNTSVFFIGIPSVSTPEFSRFNWYTDSDINTPPLAMVSCNSSGFPPTRVVWKKDNIVITEEDNAYQAMQRVVNRRSSLYINSLIIFDIFGVLGTHVYTCSIITSAGNVSQSIQTGYSGMNLESNLLLT